jgi:LysM repeat protein
LLCFINTVGRWNSFLKYFANWVEETVTTNSNTGKIITNNMNGTYTEEIYKDGTTKTEVKVIKTKEEEKIKDETKIEGTNVEKKQTNTTSNPLIVLIGQSKQVYIKYKVKKGDKILKLENQLGLKHGTPFYRLEKGKYNPIKNRDYILEKETIYYKTSIPKEGTVVTPYAQAIVQRKATVKEINLEQSGKCYVLQNQKYAPIPEDITLNQGNKIYFTKNGSEDKTREGVFNKELFDKDFNTSNQKIYIFEPYTFKKNDTIWDIERKYKVKVYKTKSLLGTNSKNFYSNREAKDIKIGTTVYLTTPGYEKTQNNTLESKK